MCVWWSKCSALGIVWKGLVLVVLVGIGEVSIEVTESCDWLSSVERDIFGTSERFEWFKLNLPIPFCRVT